MRAAAQRRFDRLPKRTFQVGARRTVSRAVRAADRVVGRVARAAQLLERAHLEFGELPVGDPDLAARGVVSDRHARVSREVARGAVIAEIESVGREQHGNARVEPLAQLALGALVVGLLAQRERDPGVRGEILLERRRASVEHPRGADRAAEVVEAEPAREPEHHRLGELGAVVREHVAQCGGGAVLAGAVGIGVDAHEAHARRISASRSGSATRSRAPGSPLLPRARRPLRPRDTRSGRSSPGTAARRSPGA